MAASSTDLLRLGERFLSRRRPGRALALLAGAPVPIVAVERIAARRPDPELAAATASPLVVELAPAPGPYGGPLGGDAVVIKDAIDVAGTRTGMGLADGGDLAGADAAIVARVRAAGGRIVGKTVMTELGMDGVGALTHRPAPPNPRAPGYAPGGSSTGTAVAVAAGLARYGVGSDGLGSVRIPAAYCGLVGLKPTHGRLPVDGYRGPVPTFDVCGPIARTVEDCARLWQVLDGAPVAPVAPEAPPVIAVIRQLGPARATRSIQAAFARALDALGARVEACDVPGADRSTFLGGILAAHELVQGPLGPRATTAAGRMNVALGRALDARDAARLTERRARLRDALAAALARVPVIAMPTTAVPPPALTRALAAGGQDLVLLRALGAYTPLANLTGVPAIAVPGGVDDRGRPLSIMFLAAHGEETRLLRAAAALERADLAARPV